MKHPDRRLREAIELVFRKFRELWSVRQTFLWFHSEGVQLPVNKKRHGRMGMVWQLPTYSFVKDMLQNPYYAGVYVWGRRQTETLVAGGKMRKRQTGYVAREPWKVFLPDHHEAYIDWDTFEENQCLMRNNSLNIEGDEGVRAVRSGQGLLVGLLRVACRRRRRTSHGDNRDSGPAQNPPRSNRTGLSRIVIWRGKLHRFYFTK